MKGEFHQPNDTATLRGVGIKVFWAYPTIVVEDTAELIALYLPAGVLGKNVNHRPTTLEMLEPESIQISDHKWRRTDVIFLIKHEDAFSVYLMWDTITKELYCWYINTQEPIQRTEIGFDTMDQMLDIVVSPNMNEWTWKDQDELDSAEKAGIYSKEKAQKIRDEAERALTLLRTERRSFYERWRDWTPDPQWILPKLDSPWE